MPSRNKSIVQLYFFEELRAVAGTKEARTWLEREQEKSAKTEEQTRSSSFRRFSLSFRRGSFPPSVKSPSNTDGIGNSPTAGRRLSVEDSRIGLMFTDAAHLLDDELE
mmetsp:Transcript_23861/g.48746  ORF Transcript_23861/g.48746 Transcript_23861/m.48746 type:complete len:108 (+) Transcript_23861:3-326(+)